MISEQADSFLQATLRKIYPQDLSWRDRAIERLEQLTMPYWAMGDFMDLAVNLAGVYRTITPSISRKRIVVMVGDHGVTEEGVSCYPPDVTTQMVHNIIDGGAAINAMSRQAGADVCVVDMGACDAFTSLQDKSGFISRKISTGTANIARGPAMSRSHAVMAIQAGVELANKFSEQVDLFGTGDMGIGNTTPSTAIAAVLTGKPVAELTGNGTGLDEEQKKAKIAVIERALSANKPDPKDGIDVLAKVGGFEIGGIAGLILGAAANQKAVVVDGFISTAGALIAYTIEPFVRDYLICAHKSVEPGHRYMLEKLQLEPLFSLNMRLGEGTGAAFAMNAVDAAVRLLTEVSTFSEAGVSTKEK
ncbi:nicotinate-nucleotide--dimethylbenzimidazole phosphoribosyltransferase [Desulfogranum japonicum]|uniref:nicotinate-nucleotide--dimethylbenzimidazole phosphoribosyltransferase n=1 Tax=Desulfogranum japonicum TaxID=231447 RepID=UPI0003FFC550|nr:nicotinate-nucleotide--dimethylbenzimidazole phosphoribosyltransferase [Desulfogranum japonicum]